MRGKIVEIIQLKNVSKKYDGKLVLDKIDKTFVQGQSVAFVGHNGCGKSTLLKIIAKLVTATSGEVVYNKPLLFHYIPEKFSPVSITARQYLIHMGALDGLGKEESKDRIESLGKDFFITDLLDTAMRSLSKGTLQKVVVLQALLKTPDVLLLDEPLSGQDMASQKVFINKINQLREQGVTIFMSCHEKRLIEAIAEDVYTFRNGSLTEYNYKTRKMYLMILENTKQLPLMDEMKKYGQYYSLKIDQNECDQMLPELIQKGWKLRGLYDEEDK